jgi:hygromycin-B 7''-O-kinase
VPEALPEVRTEEQFEAVRADEARLRPGVAQLCRRLGVDSALLSRFADGSLPVYSAGELVLKLFPSLFLSEWRVERAVLSVVGGSLPIPTPRLRDAGLHDGWGYLLMSRLRGTALSTVWDRTTVADRDRMAAHLGEAIAALHRVTPPRLQNWWPEDWPAFVARQRGRCASEQRELGLASSWVAQYPAFLQGVAFQTGPLVLLHTEVMRQHLLVTQTGDGGWRFSGLFDFEPAMRGASEYEFASVGVFVSQGDSRFLRRVLIAYGYSGGELDARLSRRLLAWALLHRYSNLASWLRRLPEPRDTTLDALAERWFGTRDS